jgi:hypothetical protein
MRVSSTIGSSKEGMDEKLFQFYLPVVSTNGMHYLLPTHLIIATQFTQKQKLFW